MAWHKPRIRSTRGIETAAQRRAVAAFLEYAAALNLDPAQAAERRRAQIAVLASKVWKGQRVYRVQCDGDFGRGPHVMWVPERILWSLIDPTVYRCAFHR